MNDIYKSTDVGKFILFADDTNLFLADNCKERVKSRWKAENRFICASVVFIVHIYSTDLIIIIYNSNNNNNLKKYWTPCI